jgi:hypothetical protein
MDSLKSERKTVKRSRLTIAELAGIFTRVKKTHEKNSAILPIHSEKILALVVNYPKYGTKRLSDSLMLEGIFLNPHSIYKFLVKHNLNRRSLRKSWKDNQKETKS